MTSFGDAAFAANFEEYARRQREAERNRELVVRLPPHLASRQSRPSEEATTREKAASVKALMDAELDAVRAFGDETRHKLVRETDIARSTLNANSVFQRAHLDQAREHAEELSALVVKAKMDREPLSGIMAKMRADAETLQATKEKARVEANVYTAVNTALQARVEETVAVRQRSWDAIFDGMKAQADAALRGLVMLSQIDAASLRESAEAMARCAASAREDADAVRALRRLAETSGTGATGAAVTEAEDSPSIPGIQGIQGIQGIPYHDDAIFLYLASRAPAPAPPVPRYRFAWTSVEAAMADDPALLHRARCRTCDGCREFAARVGQGVIVVMGATGPLVSARGTGASGAACACPDLMARIKSAYSMLRRRIGIANACVGAA